MKGYIIKSSNAVAWLMVMLFSIGCTSNTNENTKVEEDEAAKQKLQGTWMDEMDGDVLFTMRGDTLYYNDSLSVPVSFCVRHDSLVIHNHKEVTYAIKRLNSTQFHFINADGDVVELVKSDNTTVSLAKGEYKGAISLNQGKKIKNDTVIFFNDKRYHAYTQVNPTTYKVYRQSTNEDGLTVESVYYDNLVYMALYDGQNKVFGQNIMKKEFSGLVPPAYLEQAILSEIKIEGASKNGVRFVAVLSIPDSYTNYRVNIDIEPNGKKQMSI